MRLSTLSIATLGLALFSTAASAAIVPTHIPRVPTPQKSMITSCEPSLGMLRTVRKDEVMAVNFDNTVVVREVCQDDHLDGNASGLRGIIGRNDVMAAALDAAQYSSDDVVGIQFGAAGVVLLYVIQ